MGQETWMCKSYIKHDEIDIPLGHSRYGGPVLDLPDGFSIPQDLRFAAQLDLEEFSKYDPIGLLPNYGQLIFFCDILKHVGLVHYYDGPKDRLVRHIVEHEDNFFSGVLIERIVASSETWNSRFREPEDDWEEEQFADERGLVWDCFEGCDSSKIFGIPTHCQWLQEDIERIIKEDKLVLLQIGENGFNDEGVFSVFISKENLKKRCFDHCEFHWGQT